jgi:uncharacterized membrane protein YkoI
MKKQMKPVLAAGMMLAGLGVAGFALADSGGNDDVAEHRAFLASKVNIADAVLAAETKTGARAMSVEFTKEEGAFVYEIELLTKGGVELEVLVDPSNASVTVLEDDDGGDEGDSDADDDSDDQDEDEKG